MELNEYQQKSRETAIYKDQTSVNGLTYAVLALCGETGELANKLKKHLRAGTQPDKVVLADELGDVLWYTTAVAQEPGTNLEFVAQFNLDKLAARKAAKAITG
jgi:NTP pyrophosphatase (non-canonical NTP hydrolase)